jgi:peptidoglycan/LPS O-acetylase OafA/YrhL
MSTLTTTLTATSAHDGAVGASSTNRHPVRRATLISGAAAAVAVIVVAALADTADVPLAIEGEAIPLAGFAQLTLVGAILGGLLAAASNRWTARPRRTFVAASIVLALLSCIPSVAMPQDLGTRVVLVATHIVATAVIVPALAHSIRR